MCWLDKSLHVTMMTAYQNVMARFVRNRSEPPLHNPQKSVEFKIWEPFLAFCVFFSFYFGSGKNSILLTDCNTHFSSPRSMGAQKPTEIS